jgi:acetyl-CoA C-acetyltransferase
MSKLREVVIVSACRTPIGVYGGSLKSVPGVKLAAGVMKEAIKRAKIDPAIIGDVRMGSCNEHYDSMNVARVSALLAGIPDTVPGCTFNRVCTSAMEALQSSVAQIQTGYSDVCLCGGVESMSNSPYIVPGARWGARLNDDQLVDGMIHGLMVGSLFVPYPKDGPVAMMRGKPYIMGLTAEFLAAKHKISREEQDVVALRSHNNVERATKDGLFKDEMCPVEVVDKKKTVIVDKDEHFRPGLTLEAISKLPAAFIPVVGTVTAANSSGINDGATAMVIMAAETAQKLGLKPLAVISGLGKGGNPPELMGESPVPAVQNMLKRTGRKLSEYERIECHEAFAAQYLACERILDLNRDITNVNGSGIGLGHPVGSSGARIVVTLLYELMHSKKKLGMATLCGGGGVSLAVELTAC